MTNGEAFSLDIMLQPLYTLRFFSGFGRTLFIPDYRTQRSGVVLIKDPER
jgi:hypothetical protein